MSITLEGGEDFAFPIPLQPNREDDDGEPITTEITSQIFNNVPKNVWCKVNIVIMQSSDYIYTYSTDPKYPLPDGFKQNVTCLYIGKNVQPKRNAFKNLKNLEEVRFATHTVYPHTFERCTSLKMVWLGEFTYYIHDHAFTGCTSLSVVKNAERVENIGESAFANCISLKTFGFGKWISKIDDGAFQYSALCQDIDLRGVVHDDPMSIGNWAFHETGITSITLNDKPNADIGEAAFEGTNVEIAGFPGPGTKLGRFALANTKLTTAELAATVLCESNCFDNTPINQIVVVHPPNRDISKYAQNRFADMFQIPGAGDGACHWDFIRGVNDEDQVPLIDPSSIKRVWTQHSVLEDAKLNIPNVKVIANITATLYFSAPTDAGYNDKTRFVSLHRKRTLLTVMLAASRAVAEKILQHLPEELWVLILAALKHKHPIGLV